MRFASLVARIERHPGAYVLGALVSVALGTATVVVSAMGWVMYEKLDLKDQANQIGIDTIIFEFNKENENIKKQIDNINKENQRLKQQLAHALQTRAAEIDVRQYVFDDLRFLKLSQKVETFNNDSFFAPNDKNRWNFGLYDEIGLFKFIYGEDNSLLEEYYPNGQPTIHGDTRDIYVWQSKNILRCEGPSPIRRVMAYIKVQTTPIAELEKDMKAHTKDVFGDSITSHIIAVQIAEATNMARSSDKVTFQILSIHKGEDALLTSILFIYRDLRINGETIPVYYYTADALILFYHGLAYFVNSYVPSTEPGRRHLFFRWVAEWKAEFGIYKRN